MSERLDGIDIMRAFAVIMVCLVHYSPITYFFSGYLGVEIFSLISGYIIYFMHNKAKLQNSSFAFIVKRIIRIYSGAIPLIFISYLFFTATTHWNKKLSIFFPWSEVTFHTWTISNEIILYVISVAFLFKNVKLSAILSFFIYCAWIVYIIYNPSYFGGVDVGGPNFMTCFPRMLFPFVLGAFISKMHEDGKRKRLIGTLSIFYIALLSFLASSILKYNKLKLLMLIPDLIFLLSCSFIIYNIAKSNISRFLTPLKQIGRISYSIYLMHAPALFLLQSIFKDGNSFLRFCIYWMLIFIMAFLNYQLFETRFYHFCFRKYNNLYSFLMKIIKSNYCLFSKS